VTLHVAGAPTPGKGWSTELRTTQDGTGGRDLTILPANLLTYSADLQSTASRTRPWTENSRRSLRARLSGQMVVKLCKNWWPMRGQITDIGVNDYRTIANQTLTASACKERGTASIFV
jgi:hypothetical protein